MRQSFYDKWRVKLLCTNIYSTLYQISLLYSLTWKTKIKINCRQLFSNFIINVGTPFMKISFLELIFISKFMIFVVENCSEWLMVISARKIKTTFKKYDSDQNNRSIYFTINWAVTFWFATYCSLIEFKLKVIRSIRIFFVDECHCTNGSFCGSTLFLVGFLLAKKLNPCDLNWKRHTS